MYRGNRVVRGGDDENSTIEAEVARDPRVDEDIRRIRMKRGAGATETT